MNPKKISSLPSHENISRRAHELWLLQGGPDGQDLAHWLQAESELCVQWEESELTIDRERIQEFLDSFGNNTKSRGPTSLSFT